MPSSSDPPQTIPLPPSLVSTSPSLPNATQSALISHLKSTGQITDLATILTDSLARTGWTDRVRAVSLELLRNGTCDTFPDLMSEIMRRAKIPRSSTSTAGNNTSGGGAGQNANGAATNGNSTPTAGQGAGSIVVSKEWSSGPDGLPDVRIPEATVEAGVEFLKQKIKDSVEVVEDDG